MKDDATTRHRQPHNPNYRYIICTVISAYTYLQTVLKPTCFESSINALILFVDMCMYVIISEVECILNQYLCAFLVNGRE